MEYAKMLLYERPGDPLFVESETIKPDSGQVKIEIIASSLCNTSELRSFEGGSEKGYGSFYPMIPGEPGHEAVGIIAYAGKEAAGFNTGDHVVITGHGGEPCHRSCVNRNLNDIALIRPGKRDPSFAAVLEMFGCAHHCAITPFPKDYYRNKNVLVLGMGAMGLCTVQILRNASAKSVTAVDVSLDRLNRAEICKADRCLPAHELDEDFRYDVIIECSGSTSGQETACRMAPGAIIFSSYNTGSIIVNQNRWFDSNTTIYNPGILTSKSLKEVALMYNNYEINPELLIDLRIKPVRNEYIDAIRKIKQGKIIKALMEWR